MARGISSSVTGASDTLRHAVARAAGSGNASFRKFAALGVKTLAIFGSAALLSQATAQADFKTWNTASGSWDVSGNWSGGVPTTTGTVMINNNGTVTVSSDVTGEFGQIRVGTSNGGGGTIDMSGGILSGGGVVYLGYAAGSSGSATITVGHGEHPERQLRGGERWLGLPYARWRQYHWIWGSNREFHHRHG